MVHPGTLFHRRQRGIPMRPYENRSEIGALAAAGGPGSMAGTRGGTDDEVLLELRVDRRWEALLGPARRRRQDLQRLYRHLAIGRGAR